jgi:hypothetical protein
MAEIEALDFNSVVGDDGDLEFEVARVELGDIIVVIFDDLENGYLFFVVLCNQPLHMCE